MKSKLLLVAFFFLCIHHLSEALIGAVEENDQETAHHSKFSHGNIGRSPAGRGGNSGTPEVSGENGDSHSPKTQSGGGVTPLYAAAGAANNHHPQPHRGAGNHDQGTTGLEALAIATFACFLL